MTARFPIGSLFALAVWAAALATPLVLRGSQPYYSDPEVKPMSVPGVENCFQLGPRILSGGTPESEDALKALRKAGVTVLISVDGAPPEPAATRRHGLRYIHLPMGYDGAFGTNALLLAKAAASAEGKVFVHCHHGQHRGPAAAAVIALSEGTLDHAQAREWLKRAGTSEDYPGLFRMVEEFSAAAPAELAKLTADFPETVPATALVDAMLQLDRQWEDLKPLLDPKRPIQTASAAQAALLHESYRELFRDPQIHQRDAGFLSALKEAEVLAGRTRAALHARDPGARQLLEQVAASCKACHKNWRN